MAASHTYLGRLAAEFGRRADHCPHPQNTTEARDWLNGWSEGTRRQRVEAAIGAGRLSAVCDEFDYEDNARAAR